MVDKAQVGCADSPRAETADDKARHEARARLLVVCRDEGGEESGMLWGFSRVAGLYLIITRIEVHDSCACGLHRPDFSFCSMTFFCRDVK